MANTTTKMLDRFRSYPGAIQSLAADSGLARQTVYSTAIGTHARCPMNALRAIAAVLCVAENRANGTVFLELVNQWEVEQVVN